MSKFMKQLEFLFNQQSAKLVCGKHCGLYRLHIIFKLLERVLEEM